MIQVGDIVKEIVALVRERGVLSKTEILEAWPLSDEEYADLRREVLGKEEIKSGGRKRGGFVADRSHRGRPPADERSVTISLSEDWERQSVDRLCELLRHGQLEDLLGNLLHTIREVRRHQTGQDRRGTKVELASALVIQHGAGLLAIPGIRKAVASHCGLTAPGRWHPGKFAAVSFVQAAGFPLELAGVPSTEVRPDFELLEGMVQLNPLEDFQKEVQRELLNRLYHPGGRGLVTLPTGAGKTRVAVESIRYWLLDRYDPGQRSVNRGLALWLAHTEELCEQAYQCFKEVWQADVQSTPLLLGRFWGRYCSSKEAIEEIRHQSQLLPSVLISTPQRLVNLIRGNIEEGPDIILELGAATGLMIIDEAHRAAAKSYREILEVMTDLGHKVSVVGLTATPFRMEYMNEDSEAGTRELVDIFQDLIEPKETLGSDPRVRLQERSILARPRFETLETTTSLRLPGYDPDEDVDDPTIESIDRVLALRTDRSPRRILVHERIVETMNHNGSSVLYFGPSVRDAECMAYMLRASGIPSAVVSGTTRETVRRGVINGFKDGRVKVLCNCEVLTTGFDAPRVTHVFMARPTVSQVLYEQMVGRGLRGPKFGGTEVCTIVDCKDDIRGPRPTMGYEKFRKVWGEG